MNQKLKTTTIEGFGARALSGAVCLMVVLMTSPAFAGTNSGGGQLAQKATGIFQQFIDVLTSPALGAFATIMMILALGAAFLGQTSDAMKGALKVAAITFGIIASPSFVTQIIDAAGAVV